MTTCFMRRTISGLCADDEVATEIVRKVPLGEVVKVDIQRPRSHKNLRRWWALMNLIAQNSDEITSPEQAHDIVKIMAGHCSHIVSKSTGEIYKVADSIAFGRMDEDEFQAVWRRAIQAITEHIMPGVTDAELEYEIASLIGLAGGRK